MPLASLQIHNPGQNTDSDQILYSRGLSLIREKLAKSPRREVLDLGPPINANLEFFREFRCRVRIQNLYAELIHHPSFRVCEPARNRRLVLDEILSDCQGVRYDLILAWDLIDYLDQETVLSLIQSLAAYCYNGTCLYLMVSTVELIPPVPSRFSLLSDKHMRYQPASGEPIIGSRHSTRAIERMLPGFRLRHSFLSAQGIQDYLWSYG